LPDSPKLRQKLVDQLVNELMFGASAILGKKRANFGMNHAFIEHFENALTTKVPMLSLPDSQQNTYGPNE
jgi:hypothetical protein